MFTYLLGSHSWMDCLAVELFLNICFSDTAIVTLFPMVAERAVSGMLLGTGGVPTSLTLLFWGWLTVFMGWSAGTSYS